MTASVKVEFCSPAWVAHAEVFLNERAAELAGALEGQRFCLCEVFSYAPLHLRDAMARACWHFVLADGRVSAAIGERSDADVRVEIDYQTAVIFARTIIPSTGRPVEMPPQVKVSGSMTTLPPAIRELLAPLHNRLAGITA